MPLSCALLAAGAAQRFGAPKLLLPAGPHETILSRAARAALEAIDGQLLVILPRAAAMHRAALEPLHDLGVRPIENPRSDAGLGSSVALAARTALMDGADGLLVMPADLTSFAPDGLARLVAKYREGAFWAVASANGGKAQAPAIFSRAALSRLAKLEGGRGAQALLREPEGEVAVSPAVSEELSDLDRWPAYAAAAHAFGWDVELPEAIRRAEEPAGGPFDCIWRLGETLAHFSPAQETEIVAWQTEGHSNVGAMGSPEVALRLLRAAALRELRRDRA